jgi:hypothetical protein
MATFYSARADENREARAPTAPWPRSEAAMYLTGLDIDSGQPIPIVRRDPGPAYWIRC